MTEQVWWYATRAAGLMTWSTATASVIVGLLLSTRAMRARTGPWFLDLHRFLGGITVVFLVAHVFTLWADSYEQFGPRELFIPGESAWRTEAIAWGIIAAYILIAVEVSSLLRSRMSVGVWRVIHFTSFIAMGAGSYHAITAGTDVDNPITYAIAGLGSLLVFGLIAVRLQRQHRAEDPRSGHLSDNRAILEEMRQRLADLPIPEPTLDVQLVPNPELPRREPAPVAPAPYAAPEPAALSDDPFAAVPLTTEEPELGTWAQPSAADPFVAADDPFAAAPAPRAEAPESEATEFWAPERRPKSADLFEDLIGDPFESLGVADEADFPATAPVPPPPENPNVFATPVAGEPAVDFSSNPFEQTMPAPSVIHTPVESAPAPAPVAAATTVVAGGPPPLPTAVDPVTGEPDEAAYTEWLKDWLAYAERYGDEAPEDPSRVL